MKKTGLPQPSRISKAVFWKALLGAVVISGIYGYLLYTVRHMEQHTAALQTEIKRLNQQESEVGQLRKNLSSTEERQATLVSYFIDANNPVPFLETVEGYATQAGATAKFDTVEVKSNPNRLDASVIVNGSFSGIYRFIALLEAAPYEFSITSAEIQSAVPAGLEATGSGPHSSGWEARINMSVTSITGVK